MSLGTLSHISGNAIPVDVRRAGSRGRGGSWRTAHERGVWRGQRIVLVPETLGRRGTILQGRIEGCPAVGTRRERIWVAGVRLEGEVEGGWRRATHKDWLCRLVGRLWEVLKSIVCTVVEYAQPGLTDRLSQGRRRGGGHDDSGGTVAFGF